MTSPSTPVPLTKPDAVRERIVAEIRSGELAHGERLPGEHALASRFEVSRSTVRHALADLQRSGYIATQAGSGSFVTYDGRDIAPTESWSAAFAAHGLDSSVRVLQFAVVHDPALADELRLESDAFVAMDRVRLVTGHPVSLERSRMPLTGELTDLVEHGLVGGSLTSALEQRGLVVHSVEEWASLQPLSPAEAGPLGCDVGEAWLALVSQARSAGGRLVEHITSWLDPTHFHLHHTTVRTSDADQQS